MDSSSAANPRRTELQLGAPAAATRSTFSRRHYLPRRYTFMSGCSSLTDATVRHANRAIGFNSHINYCMPSPGLGPTSRLASHPESSIMGPELYCLSIIPMCQLGLIISEFVETSTLNFIFHDWIILFQVPNMCVRSYCRKFHNLAINNFVQFSPPDAMHSADYAVARCLSVTLSVCLSVCHTPVLCRSKRLYISSNIFHRRVGTPLYFFRTKRYGNIRRPTPQQRRRIQERYEINRDF